MVHRRDVDHIQIQQLQVRRNEDPQNARSILHLQLNLIRIKRRKRHKEKSRGCTSIKDDMAAWLRTGSEMRLKH